MAGCGDEVPWCEIAVIDFREVCWPLGCSEVASYLLT